MDNNWPILFLIFFMIVLSAIGAIYTPEFALYPLPALP